MLTGTYTYSLDAKGRVVLPAPMRARLGPAVIVARAPKGCALVFSPEAWEAIADTQGAGWYRDYWLSAAYPCLVDRRTGRILLPPDLRAHLGLQPFDEVTIAGLGEAALLCRRERFSARLHQLEVRILGLLTGAASELATAA